ncbi:hypothetical protein BDZ89DRAFT_1156345 [Hymenopellis radicata]|nr:hypothetical protein BDZ89DRAFT_1156345 [Hymenopellis radicata]
MSPTTKVLLLGATGYIGGSVLLRALERPGLKTLIHDANFVEGTPTDASLLKELIKDTDVIIDTYSGDDMVGTANLLAGCKAKYQATGRKTEVIHVSGVGVIADDARGMDVPHKVYDDADVEEMAKIPEEHLHRNVDLEFLKAETEDW